MDLDAATDELYGLVPEAFLPRRAELAAAARSAGDRELAEQISGLRKPSVGAWAVNHVVRTRPGDIERLTDLAAGLRAAQQSLDGAALKTLGRQRAALVDALVHATVDQARGRGVTVSSAASRDVADTFVAALASPEATAAVVSGRLTRTLTYAGFGDVDLSDATARPLRAVPRAPDDAPAADEPDDPSTPAAKADPEAEAAQAALRAAVAAATETAQHRSAAAAELQSAEIQVAELTRAIAEARAARDAAADALASAEVADEAARADVQGARDALDALRAREERPRRRRRS